jgi:RND family efflux transporter MFP subunit
LAARPDQRDSTDFQDTKGGLLSMAKTRKTTVLVGKLIGVVLLAAAIYSVFIIDWKTEVPEEPPVVRPLKTMVIDSAFGFAGRKYPGKVRAGREVDLAFQVPGALTELNVKKGDEVEQGALLARIDPRDYESDVAAKQGELEKARYDFEKIERLFADGNAGQQEVVDARRTLDVAESAADVAAKALEDTYLRAPFAGVIANRFVENFQNVMAKQRILSLQDVSSVEIEVMVPEQEVALSQEYKGKRRFAATFDYLPGREFEVEVKEFATEADPRTQTYAARLTMPAPTDVLILPGMTATVTPHLKDDVEVEDAGYLVPIDAVPVDGLGAYFVWRVEEQADGTLMVHRVDVKVGEMMEDEILVIEGLKRGDRIATAGVHHLVEGQQIRLLGSQPGGDS